MVRQHITFLLQLGEKSIILAPQATLDSDIISDRRGKPFTRVLVAIFSSWYHTLPGWWWSSNLHVTPIATRDNWMFFFFFFDAHRMRNRCRITIPVIPQLQIKVHRYSWERRGTGSNPTDAG